jgi:3-deoxy-manno-octulosonate cytidylyltransferase (CMP-KDO synthetase)
LLLSYADFAAKTPIEQIEDIEILRFLELGNKVQMIDMSDVSVPVDFPGDVEKVEARLRQASIQ